MNKYEIIIDLGSKTFVVEAETREEAEQKGLILFENLPIAEKCEEYWVGECCEVKNNEN